jgi:predicted dehydrogenase
MTDQQQRKTLYDIKKGDKVIHAIGFFNPKDKIVSVDRTTPTLIIIHGGDRFRKSDGMLVGSQEYYERIFVATEEKIARIKYDTKYARVKGEIYDFCDYIQRAKKTSKVVTLEQLEHTLELLEKAYAALSIDPTTTTTQEKLND